MKPGNDLGRAGLLLFAAVCEFVCELLLLLVKGLRSNGWQLCCFSQSRASSRDFQRVRAPA